MKPSIMNTILLRKKVYGQENSINVKLET